MARTSTRVFALVLLVSAMFGGSLPEFGNIVAYYQGSESKHIYDTYFLVGGILGIIICGWALVRGQCMDNSSRMVKR